MRRWAVSLVVLIVAAAALGALVSGRAVREGASADNTPQFVVQRGPLTISVTESGTIKPREQKILKSEVEGQTTIIYLIPEGALVKEGQLLVELDASGQEDQKVDQQIRVQNAEAAFIRARENLEVVKSQGTSDIAAAKLADQFAQEDLTQYLEGEFPKELKEAESRITLAEEERERAKNRLTSSEALSKRDYVSKTELEADRLAFSRAQLDLELAVATRDLLKDFTYKRKLAQLQSDIDQTHMALDRVERKAKADIVQAEADLKAKEAEFGQQQDKLNKIEEQITKAKIYAPISGMVVYATSARGSWRGNAEPLDEGQSVRERQELIYLPTADAMMAEIKIHEASLDKVSLGLPVRVTVDALPGKTFSGRVSKIAPLPDAQSMWLNPDLKVYSAEIDLEGTGMVLRTGMSCQAEILVDRYEDAISVPVQAVVRVGREPTVFVVEDGQMKPQTVELGLDNNRMVRIVSGLEPGQTVSLAPPLAVAAVQETVVAEATESSEMLGPSGAPSGPDATRALPRGPDRADAQPRGQREGGGDRGDAERSGRRRPSREMTPEQREERRRRFENLSPEQREQLRQRRSRQRQEPRQPAADQGQ
jgi:HlyD family secretion protein